MQIVQKKGNMKIYFAINMRRLQKKKKNDVENLRKMNTFHF